MGKSYSPEELVDANLAKLGRGQYAAARYLANKCREKVSVQAPTIPTRSIYKRAATPATPGAPPRRVGGFFKISIEEVWDEAAQAWAVGSEAKQARRLEEQGHLWLTDTVEEEAAVVAAILAREAG